MKKLLIFGAVLASLGFASCGSGAGSGNGFDTIYSQSKVDTLFNSIARVQGCQNGVEFSQRMLRDSSLSKEAFMKGFMYAFGADTTESFLLGLQNGGAAINYVANFNKDDIKIDRASFLKNFREGFMSEGNNDSIIQALSLELNMRWPEFQQAMQTYQEAKVLATPVSQDNLKAGRAYIDSLRQADPALTILASGVAIKVDTIGTGENVKEGDRLFIDMKSQTLGGRVYENIATNPERPLMMAAFVPGLQEALKQMTVGTVATVYVPGPEAYGANMNKRYRIAPNEMLIFNLKINGVSEPK